VRGLSRWRLCYEVMEKAPLVSCGALNGEIGAGGLGFVAVQPQQRALVDLVPLHSP
jgi:hypothetical protein